MGWFERQLITVLSIILGLLFAAVLIVLSFRYQASQEARREEEEAAAAAAAAAAQQEETVRSPFVELSYHNGSVSLSFALDEEEHWYWAADRDFPLRENALAGIIGAAVQLRPLQTFRLEVEPGEENEAGGEDEGEGEDGALQKALAEYGLSDPAATFRAVTPEGKEVSVIIGRAVEESENRYALLNGDEYSVCEISGALYQALQTPIYEMYALSAFPILTEDVIESIVVQGAFQDPPEELDEEGETAQERLRLTTVLTAHHGELGASWRAAGANVTDVQVVRALLSELAALQPLRCVDYRPSDEAAEICGLAPAEAIVNVRYTDDSDGESHFILALGALTPDGTGRYVQVGEDSTILLVHAANLNAVTELAEKGME